MSTRQAKAVAAFHALHAGGCFVLPNPWDAGTARYLQHVGFTAVATTSAGAAFSRGLPDSVSALPCEAVLDHVREIVAATPLPVNADFQAGYATELADLADNVSRCVATGVAGLSIEDATGDPEQPLYERSHAIERVRTARQAIDASGVPVLLTARCEAWLVGATHAQTTAIDRLVAFADEGADCLYAPGVKDADTIATIVRAVAPRPVNVLISAPVPGLNVRSLTDLGVRRISVGSALARVAWGGFMAAATSIHETGEFHALQSAVPFAELNAIFT